MKKILFAFTLLVTFSFAFSQKALKIGHVDSQELISLMPEKDSAQKKIQDYATELQKTSQTMQTEFQQKYQEYAEKGETFSKLIKENKEKELRGLQERMQQFEQNAKQDLQKKQADLFQPIIDKAKKAVSDVARKEGFTYVFDKSSGSIVFEGEGSIDLLPLVKKELKLK